MSRKQIDKEMMRILAAFFVIFNHTGTNGFFLFSLYEKDSPQFWCYLVLSVFCKFAVPLFLMISGALVLGKDPEPISRVWIHRVMRMFLVLFFWSFFYYVVEILRGRQGFDLKTFLTQSYDRNWNFSFWYLYTYIAFLMTIPILKKFSRSLSDKEYLYLIGLFLSFNAILPAAQFLLWQGRHGLNGFLRIGWIDTSIFFFPLFGYFLQHRAKDFWDKRKIIVLWGINLCTILLSCYLTYYKAVVTGVCDEGHSQDFHGIFTLVNCACIFVTCQNVKIKEKVQRVIYSMGSCTLGIYLLHVFFMNAISRVWDIFQDKLHMNSMLASMGNCIVVFLLGYTSTLIIKRIPILNKLV